MDEQLKSNISSSASWIRLLFMIFFAICLQLASFVMGAVVIIQFLFVLIGGERNEELRRFGACLSEYFYAALKFLTYNSESKPFPFSEWPSAESEELAVHAEDEPLDASVEKEPPPAAAESGAGKASATQSTEEHAGQEPGASSIVNEVETPPKPSVSDNSEEHEPHQQEMPEEALTNPRRKRTRKSDNKSEAASGDEKVIDA